MSNRRFTEEFKSEAVKQVTGRGYKVREVSERLGISTKSMYVWLMQARGTKGRRSLNVSDDVRQENLRLRAELKRVEEERDILKEAAAYFARAFR